MTEWLEFERSNCLHETSPGVLENWIVTMPRLSTKEGRWEAGAIQKYENKQGKILWRSLNLKRQVFRSNYTSRETCAQEMVRDCPSVVRTIAYRKAKLAQRPLDELSPEARAARLPLA